ncbi:MAG: choice-of-anchor Q domain-containing protein [Kofleriaceae bacterium]
MTSHSISCLTVAVGVAVGLAVTGCKNENYCEGNPNNDCRLHDADGPQACTGNQDCAGGQTPVCDVTGSMTCVECLPNQADACSGTTPACGNDHACRGCTAHAECASSDVCLPDGSCADEGTVAYVDPEGTDNSNCTNATPCTKVDKALATTRPYVKFTGTTDAGATVVIENQAVTLLADPQGKLTRTNNGLLLEVRGASQVSIFDLEVGGASGLQGIGISMPAGNTSMLQLTRANVSGNAGGGIFTSGGTLTVTQSTISGNAGGGVSISNAQFDLTNNLIVQNGGPASLIGGINLASVSGTGAHRLDFNTISANAGTSTVNSGVNCGIVGAAIIFTNNIIYGNTVSGGGKQVGGSTNCSATYSNIGPDATPGPGNINLDPLFTNAAQGNFHITPASPAKNAADPAATLAVDVDGEARPQGSARDIGADEIP